MACDNCGKQNEGNGFMLTHLENVVPCVEVCSPSCLVELAWRLKEAQSKLSKSRSKDEDK